MTGKQLAAKARHSGFLYVPMMTPNDVIHVVAEKKGFIADMLELGDQETGLELTMLANGNMWVDIE